MTKEMYQKMTQPFRSDAKLALSLHIVNKIITGISFMAYPCLLVYLFVKKDILLGRAILVPFLSFVAVSGFRHLVNRERPYEKFGMKPVLPKDTKGKSFPSRHVFSSTIIAMTYLLLSPWTALGWFLIAISVCLGIIRVISGLHYISDVVAGAALGVLAGVLGYMVF